MTLTVYRHLPIHWSLAFSQVRQNDQVKAVFRLSLSSARRPSTVFVQFRPDVLKSLGDEPALIVEPTGGLRSTSAGDFRVLLPR